jgi:cytochrome c-type biogenesis protein CcmF
MTVLGQFLFWKRQDAESLAADLLWPVAISCVATLATIIIGDVRNIYYMVYLLASWFAVIGNGVIMYRLIRQKPMLIGGTLSHVGFGVLLLGILASSAYNEMLLDESVKQYNAAIERGEVTDEQGFQKTQKVDFLELKLNKPKVIDDRYKVTYEGYTLKDQARPGQQEYRIKFEPADGEGEQFVLNPQVYPMLSSSSQSDIQWSVDPDVRTGLMSDIYLYVAGSSFVERRNAEAKESAAKRRGAVSSDQDSIEVQEISIGRGETIKVGEFDLSFEDYVEVDDQQLKDSTIVAIRANLKLAQRGSDSSVPLRPLFSIYVQDEENWTYAPPVSIPGYEDASIQFTSVDPSNGGIDLKIRGIETEVEEQWVLLVAEEKPFISVVWLGTFLLMAGFSVSIFRHWGRERKKST